MMIIPYEYTSTIEQLDINLSSILSREAFADILYDILEASFPFHQKAELHETFSKITPADYDALCFCFEESLAGVTAELPISLAGMTYFYRPDLLQISGEGMTKPHYVWFYLEENLALGVAAEKAVFELGAAMDFEVDEVECGNFEFKIYHRGYDKVGLAERKAITLPIHFVQRVPTRFIENIVRDAFNQYRGGLLVRRANERLSNRIFASITAHLRMCGEDRVIVEDAVGYLNEGVACFAALVRTPDSTGAWTHFHVNGPIDRFEKTLQKARVSWRLAASADETSSCDPLLVDLRFVSRMAVEHPCVRTYLEQVNILEAGQTLTTHVGEDRILATRIGNKVIARVYPLDQIESEPWAFNYFNADEPIDNAIEIACEFLAKHRS